MAITTAELYLYGGEAQRSASGEFPYNMHTVWRGTTVDGTLIQNWEVTNDNPILTEAPLDQAWWDDVWAFVSETWSDTTGAAAPVTNPVDLTP